MSYLGLTDKKIDLNNFLLKNVRKNIFLLNMNYQMYLEYYDISMKFDFSEKYKKEPRIKIDFNINGLDNVPF